MLDDRTSEKAEDMYSTSGTGDGMTVGIEVVKSMFASFVTLCNMVPELYGGNDVEGALLLVLDGILGIDSEGEGVEGKLCSRDVDVEEDFVSVDVKTTESMYVADMREVSFDVSDTLVLL